MADGESFFNPSSRGGYRDLIDIVYQAPPEDLERLVTRRISRTPAWAGFPLERAHEPGDSDFVLRTYNGSELKLTLSRGKAFAGSPTTELKAEIDKDDADAALAGPQGTPTEAFLRVVLQIEEGAEVNRINKVSED